MKSKLIFLVILALFSGSSAWGTAKKTRCKSGELDRKACFLKIGKASYRISAEKIAIDDGTWRGVEDLPMAGENTQWHALQLNKISDREILQLQIWGEPKTAAKIQSLYWYIMEIHGTELKLLHRAEVQKRRIVPPEEGSEEKYIFDQSESYGLKPVKDGKIQWQVGSQSGLI